MDRLTPLDLMSIWPEARGWSQDIGALVVLDGAALPRRDGALDLDALRRHVATRLHLVPRFRQVLLVPRRGLGWPLWVDDQDFDVAHHVHVHPVPAPADEAGLLEAVEALRGHRLDPARPRWAMWFLTGLPDGDVGLFVKVHHAIADGLSGVASFAAFVDADPTPPPVAGPDWTPAPRPSSLALFVDNLRGRGAGLARAARGLRHPARAWRTVRAAWPALREAFFEEPAPHTSLNARGIGWHRRLALVRTDLDEIRAIAHARGATVNDVLMTLVAGGLRAVLLARGEPVTGVVLRAAVPVALARDRSGHPGRGNETGMMIVPLPVGEPDATRRLDWIAARTRERKRTARPQGGMLFRNGLIQRAFLGLAHRQRASNTYVANVPGPPVPLFLAGAPIRELHAVVPLLGNMAVGVGALSYAGQFNLTVVADRELVPDTAVVAAGIAQARDALCAPSPLPTSPPRTDAAWT